MTVSPSVCRTWNAERDEAFFRIVRGLFPPAFLAGADVLLASYDSDQLEDAEALVPAAPAQRTAVAQHA